MALAQRERERGREDRTLSQAHVEQAEERGGQKAEAGSSDQLTDRRDRDRPEDELGRHRGREIQDFGSKGKGLLTRELASKVRNCRSEGG